MKQQHPRLFGLNPSFNDRQKADMYTANHRHSVPVPDDEARVAQQAALAGAASKSCDGGVCGGDLMGLDSDVVIGGAKGATSARPELDRGAQAAGAEEPRSESAGPLGSLRSGRGGPGDGGRAGRDLRSGEARGTSDTARDAHRTVRALLEEVDGRARDSIGSTIRRRRGRRRRSVPVEGARVAEQTALVVAASRPGAEGPYGGDRGAPALDADGALLFKWTEPLNHLS